VHAEAAALGIVAAGSVVVWGVAAASGGRAPVWAGLGTIWIALPCVALLWIDQQPRGGFSIYWLLAVVWASDIGAYGFGRTFGGPRLAPRFSPNKTWSGAVGGLICSGLAGIVAALLLGAPLWTMAGLSAFLSVVAQIGDLTESLAKRKFGVKDSGSIIPGHGGLLDRLDSLLTTAPALALLILLGGVAPLAWRL
jgi:phosphatidate cytidylyltransferase